MYHHFVRTGGEPPYLSSCILSPNEWLVEREKPEQQLMFLFLLIRISDVMSSFYG